MYAPQTAEAAPKTILYRENAAMADRTAADKAAVNRTGVPDHMKRQYEELSGLSMDDVRVHYNSGKPSQLGALAYTQGNHVYVAPGQERQLGHELGHVIQQKQGRVRATDYFGGVAVNLDDRLEREADAYDRQAGTYRIGNDGHRGEEYGVMPKIGTSMSDSAAQLRPVVDKRRRWPFYVDDKYDQESKPRFLLKFFVEMGKYVVFQIRDHIRRIFWEKDQKWIEDNPEKSVSAETAPETQEEIPVVAKRGKNEDKYFTNRELNNEFNIEEFMSLQPLDAWLEIYEEAMGTLAEIDADTAMSPAEKKRQKDAITNYVLQRHIVNALYRTEELNRMDYSGSPLSYQDRSSYMRSGAGSYVNAWREVLIKKDRARQRHDYKNSNNLILTRSRGMQQELDKFFQYYKLGEQETWSDDLIQTLMHALDGLTTGGRNDMERLIFMDATDSAQAPGVIKYSLKQTIMAKIAQETEWRESITNENKQANVNQRLNQQQERQAFFIWYINKLNIQKTEMLQAAEGQAAEAEIQEMERKIQRAESLSHSDDDLEESDTDIVEAYMEYAGHWAGEAFTKKMENFGKKVMVGKMISLSAGGIQQDAILLADTNTDRDIKAAVNKTGYVPSITEAIRKQLDYAQKEGQNLFLKDIALRVFSHQKSNWSKDRADRKAVDKNKVRDRINEPGSAEYKMADRENARKLAHTFYRSFCQKLVYSPDMKDPENRRIFVQASTVHKLTEACKLFENERIPAFVWYQLDYYLEAAMYPDKYLVDFTRNIQAIHEIILLGIELQGEAPVSRGEEFRLAELETEVQEPQAQEAEPQELASREPEAQGAEAPPENLYQGAYLADYGLKAFAQVYDAAAAQHAEDSPPDEPLQVAAFYNIYFELTEKLNATTGANPGRVQMKTPESVEKFVEKLQIPDSAAESGEAVMQTNKLPDIIMIDIHPNDATKETITRNDVSGMLDVINDYMVGNNCRRKITVIVDITLNQATDDEVRNIRQQAADYLAAGWLNLVFVQSLTKFAQMGMDKHSGGLVFSYNKADDWQQFNNSLQAGREADPVDPYMQRYFQMLFDNAADEQREYIDIIRENTRYVQAQLSEALAGTAITLSVNNDEGSCYVAWHYRDSYSKILQFFEQKGQEPYSLHQFNIAILEYGINSRMSKQKLPVAMRFSFGFPISNLGETGDEVRFTIGTETKEELKDYIREIKLIADTVQDLIKNEQKDILLNLELLQQTLCDI